MQYVKYSRLDTSAGSYHSHLRKSNIITYAKTNSPKFWEVVSNGEGIQHTNVTSVEVSKLISCRQRGTFLMISL